MSQAGQRRPHCHSGAAAALAAALLVSASALAAGSNPPKLYTSQQAMAGLAVYATRCASCHGADEQGTSAPPSAGPKFLAKTKLLGWSVGDMRRLVVSSMPLNQPGSLSPEQYAQVLAFLLASDCYPAGPTPFPIHSTAKLRRTPLVPVTNSSAAAADGSVCTVK